MSAVVAGIGVTRFSRRARVTEAALAARAIATAVREGLRVTVEFDDVADDVSLPHWRVA